MANRTDIKNVIGAKRADTKGFLGGRFFKMKMN